MARTRFTVEQIIAMLREAEVRLGQGHAKALAFQSRAITGGAAICRLKLDQAKRLKDLERENERLGETISELTLAKLILIGKNLRENTKPSRRRDCARHGAPGLVPRSAVLAP